MRIFSSALRSRLTGLVASVLAVALVTGVVAALRPVAPVLSLGVLYVFAVLPIAVVWGLGYALPVSIVSMLVFNWLFLPPTHTLALHDSANWVALAVYLVTAVLVSELAARARRRGTDAEQQRREAAFAASVSGLLLEPGIVQERVKAIADEVGSALGAGRVRIELESLRRAERGESARDLVAGDRHVGQIFFECTPDPEIERRVLPALASLLASALDRERLSRQAIEAETLRRSDATKTTILRSLSHDLRSPLTAITTAGDMLADPQLTATDRAELVETVRVEARRLSRLVSNLLDLSRLEAGAALPRPELWSADGLVARALEAVGPEAGRVDVSLGDESATVVVDPTQLERALVNLLENALRFSSPTDPVELRVEVRGGEVLLHVTDHGPGLAPSELERIFEPFERAESGGGAGLGLPIARGFVQANGGSLWAESEPGAGATFSLALPVSPSRARLRS
jgi:two-component system sensor histidine kinase KdpD